MQERGVNRSIARQVDYSRGNNLATALIACENVEVGAGLLKRRCHSPNRLRIKNPRIF